MSSNNICQDQLDQFNALSERQKIEKQVQDAWISKNTEMNNKIALISNKWDMNYTNSTNQSLSPDCCTAGGCDGSNQCNKINFDYMNEYEGCGFLNAGVKFKCKARKSWYDAQKDSEINDLKQTYNISSSMPSVTPINFQFTCQVCNQSMDICNSLTNPEEKANCVVQNISQNQTCTLNVDGSATKNTETSKTIPPTTKPITKIPQNLFLIFLQTYMIYLIIAIVIIAILLILLIII